MMEKKQMTVQKKTGVLSSLITLIVVACLILANVAAAVITEKYPVKIDLTSEKAFQLSQDSIDYLSGMEKPVDITIFNTKDGFSGSGDYSKQAATVIEQYAKHNSNIKIVYEDLLAKPALASSYPDLDLQVNDILVQCGEKQQKLTAYDIYNIESNWYGGTITSSKAEQAMTGAIMNVVDENKIKVAFLTGHDEFDENALSELLQKNGFEAVQASLLTEGVPEDATVAVISAPRRDITEAEAKKLDQFMENGGAYGRHLLYFASLEQAPLPILEAWLAKWGLSIGEGAVLETDPARVMNQNPYYGIVTFDDTTLTEKMTSYNVPSLIPFCRPVERLFETNLGYTTKTLLSYSAASGIAGADIETLDQVVPSGPISVGGMSTYNKDGKQSSVLVFGSNALLDAGLFESGSISNADYVLSVFNTLTKRENVISIAPKVLGGGYIAISQAEVIVWAILLIVIFPIIVLCAGLAIWSRRKRR